MLDDHLKFNINAKGMMTNQRFADTGAVGAAVRMDPTHPVYDFENEPYVNKLAGYCGIKRLKVS